MNSVHYYSENWIFISVAIDSSRTDLEMQNLALNEVAKKRYPILIFENDFLAENSGKTEEKLAWYYFFLTQL